MTKLLALQFSILIISVCVHVTFGQNPDKGIKTSIENQVDSVFSKMLLAAEKIDYNQLSQGVDDRYNTGFLINGSYYLHYDSLIANLTANRSAVTKQKILLKNKKTTTLSEKTVLVTASGESVAETIYGQTFSLNFLWSFVYENFNGEW